MACDQPESGGGFSLRLVWRDRAAARGARGTTRRSTVAGSGASASTLLARTGRSGGARATLVRPQGGLRHEVEQSQVTKALQTAISRLDADPLLTRDSAQTTRNLDLQVF